MTTTTTKPDLTVAEVFAALVAGETRTLDTWEFDLFSDAPEGSRIFAAGEWTYLIGANFRVEAFSHIEEDGDTVAFSNDNANGEWVAA